MDEKVSACYFVGQLKNSNCHIQFSLPSAYIDATSEQLPDTFLLDYGSKFIGILTA
jgi:hypothetical protein